MSLPARVARYATEFALASAETGLHPLLIAAICYHESLCGDALTPPGPHGLGDNGFAHGLMQIDSRSWSAWLAAKAWWVPQVNICKGAEILNANLIRFESTFDPIFLAVAAYNCGPGNVHAALAHAPPDATPEKKRQLVDRRTADGCYAATVLAHFERFKTLCPTMGVSAPAGVCRDSQLPSSSGSTNPGTSPTKGT